eukprot:SAG31_NODE_35462_length_323_cov_0.580357_1_plen_71_part_10
MSRLIAAFIVLQSTLTVALLYGLVYTLVHFERTPQTSEIFELHSFEFQTHLAHCPAVKKKCACSVDNLLVH